MFSPNINKNFPLCKLNNLLNYELIKIDSCLSWELFGILVTVYKLFNMRHIAQSQANGGGPSQTTWQCLTICYGDCPASVGNKYPLLCKWESVY